MLRFHWTVACAVALIAAAASDPALADHPGVGFGASSSGPVHTLSAVTLTAGTGAIGLEVTHEKSDPSPTTR